VSYIKRIPPSEPERDRLEIVLEELRDVFAIMETLSLRLAKLEERKTPPASCADYGEIE
jgi:hypothetical protein